MLRRLFVEQFSAELRAPVPYLPGVQAPYYLFVGERGDLVGEGSQRQTTLPEWLRKAG